MKKEQLIKNGLKYQFKNEAENDEHVLTLSGFVGDPDIFDMLMGVETINPQDVASALDDVDNDIRIRINSGGGDVFAGIEIYNYLKNHPSNITVEVTALAASAASVIAMAGDKIVMDTGSSMMIHQASTIAWGDKSEIKKAMNALKSIDGSLVDIYAERTGIDTAELDELLTGETWFTADEAVEKGFADEKTSKQAETVEIPKEPEEEYAASLKIEMSDEIKEMFDSMKSEIKSLKESKEPQPQNSGYSRFLF